MEHIAEAAAYAKHLQVQQLRWAESGPESAAALGRARKAAVLRVLARAGVSVNAHDWVRSVCCGEADAESDLGTGLILLEELWLDVVVEADAWARRVLASAVEGADARV